MSPEIRMLVCGDVSVQFDTRDGQLRYLRLGSVELLRGIYATVRDENWDTVPPGMSDLKIDSSDEKVKLTFDVRHQAAGVDFFWKGAVRIDAVRGRLTYYFDGSARSTFRRNRIGFCVLHAAELGGARWEAELIDGTRTKGKFPLEVSPHQPLQNLRAIRHEPAPGISVEVRLEGDVFEMEDQRNWTDASYKTYCTPLSRPFPVEIASGERVVQRIEASWQVSPGAGPVRTVSAPVAEMFASDWLPMPQIGFGASGATACDAVLDDPAGWRRLRASHLRVDLRADDPDMDLRISVAGREARLLDTRLEIAVFADDSNPRRDFIRVATALREAGLESRIRRWLIFGQDASTTPAGVMGAARAELLDLSPEAEWVAGTDAYFAELNRAPAMIEEADAVTFSINPQVHAFDDLSLLETLAMHEVVVRDARRIGGGRPVVVSPVTLRPRFNPNAAAGQGRARAGDPDADPSTIDSRQATGFTAAWALGSIGSFLRAGLGSATYFRLSGPSGLAHAGNWLPVGRLFQAVGDFLGANARFLTSTEKPTTLFGLHLNGRGRHRLLLANAGIEPRPVPRLPEMPSGTAGVVVAAAPPIVGCELSGDLPPHSVSAWDWSPASQGSRGRTS